MAKKVQLTVDGPVARLEIARPRKANSLDRDVLSDFMDHLDTIEGKEEVKLTTVRGAGGTFSAGVDLGEVLGAVEDGDRERLQEVIDGLHDVVNRLETLSVPTVAIVEGHCLAGGLEVMLACDLCISTTEALIGDQHANYGLIQGGGASQRLPRRVGERRALELMYLGRSLSGAEAEDWGLVNSAVPPDDIETAVRELEAAFETKARRGLALTKYLVKSGRSSDRETALELERNSAVEYLMSEEAVEGLRSFKNGTQPDFTE